jgi:prepilin-type N-terminal cleavage/methylation domain-containing protein
MRRARSDAGFTLPELLVAIVLGGLVVSAVSAALIAALGNTATSADRMASSQNANLLSIYFTRDIASATDVLPRTRSGPCLTSRACVRLRWFETEYEGGAEVRTRTYQAVYAVVADRSRGNGFALQRTYRVDGDMERRTVVAHDLSARNDVSIEVGDKKVTITVDRAGGRDHYSFTLSGTAGARATAP